MSAHIEDLLNLTGKKITIKWLKEYTTTAEDDKVTWTNKITWTSVVLLPNGRAVTKIANPHPNKITTLSEQIGLPVFGAKVWAKASIRLEGLPLTGIEDIIVTKEIAEFMDICNYEYSGLVFYPDESTKPDFSTDGVTSYGGDGGYVVGGLSLFRSDPSWVYTEVEPDKVV